MAASLNSVTLIGNLGTDPELKNTTTGRTVATFRLATNDRWKEGNELKERTEWHTVEVWGDQAKRCAEYLRSGRLVYVAGANRTESWEKDGLKHSRTKVVASRVLFLDSPEKGEVAGDAGGADQPL